MEGVVVGTIVSVNLYLTVGLFATVFVGNSV